MSINVLERVKEIGIMRSIGASNRSVLSVFIFEGLLIGVMSWFLGALFAVPIGSALANMVGNLFLKAPLGLTYSFQGAVLWLGIVLVISVLASFYPAWNATRITVREVLAHE